MDLTFLFVPNGLFIQPHLLLANAFLPAIFWKDQAEKNFDMLG